ncbi:hypothetical protein E1B28_000193 [Marasmius oreades]|uniref:C2H2-type domain-containing protein n=1 Tax=Marasmius oreades TaxID=181124 RepID=A0A9P7V0R6_9AGAR|nr:uncharacterized protein E1B28_000193 [Marasmius oreades]KAG7098226.1 hypothetical protein E1B28_000193 [Marasmius oreades]
MNMAFNNFKLHGSSTKVDDSHDSFSLREWRPRGNALNSYSFAKDRGGAFGSIPSNSQASPHPQGITCQVRLGHDDYDGTKYLDNEFLVPGPSTSYLDTFSSHPSATIFEDLISTLPNDSFTSYRDISPRYPFSDDTSDGSSMSLNNSFASYPDEFSDHTSNASSESFLPNSTLAPEPFAFQGSRPFIDANTDITQNPARPDLVPQWLHHHLVLPAPLATGVSTDATVPRPQVGSKAITLAALSIRKRKPIYFCPITGCTSKGFTTGHGFKYHQRSHQNVRPFICPSCSRGFGSRSDLLRHQKRLKGACAGVGVYRRPNLID